MNTKNLNFKDLSYVELKNLITLLKQIDKTIRYSISEKIYSNGIRRYNVRIKQK